MIGFTNVLNRSSIPSNVTIVLNSDVIITEPNSSNSHTNDNSLFDMKTDTDLFLPIVFIKLKISAFFMYGIFLPSVAILSAYNR